jgi:hypothetical protein
MGSRNQKPWPFEVQWRGRLALGTKLLSDLQDFWLRSQKAFPTREGVAVLIRIFSLGDPQRGEDWHRSAGEWISLVRSPETECELLSPRSGAALVNASIEDACSIVSAAAESWETRSLAEPAVDLVVSDVLDQLSADGIVKLYYG